VSAIKNTLWAGYRLVRGGGHPSLLRRRQYHARRQESERAVLCEASTRPDMFLAVACPACGGSDVCDRFSNSIGFSFCTCARDGTVYMNPAPSADTLERLYNDEAYTAHWYDPAVIHAVDPDDYARASAAVEVGPGQTWLDVGCSTGEFLKFARARFECHGVEINPERAQTAREEGFQVTTGTLADVEGRERFDVITMLQVIEHLVEPAQPLADVRRLLKPQGIFYLNTPCADSASFALFRERHMHVSSFGHVGLYTKEGLARLAERCGFSMTDHGYCGGMDIDLHDLIGHRLARSRFRHRVAFYSPRYLNFCDLIDQLTLGRLTAALRPRGHESYHWAVFRTR
jgi:cyclopropane fatty-acyl-phospholipid synthase-like methyltransferase